jgi:hypothetical protein
MFKRFAAVGAAVVVLLAGLAAPAMAVPCGTTPGLDTNEVTFRGINSDDCSGVHAGNINSVDDANAVPLFGGGWQILLNESSTITFQGVEFSLSDAPQDTEGVFTLTFNSNPDTTIFADLLIPLKAGNEYAAYFFDNEEFTTDGSGEGTFKISFLNNGGQTPDLSHMSVLFRPGDGDVPPGEVPEPTTMLLLGAGLIAATLGGRRFAPRR